MDQAVISEVAKKHGKSPAQIMLRWCIEHKTVPLPKSNSKEHLAENLDVFDFELSKQDVAAINELNEDYSVLSSHNRVTTL